MKPARLSLPLLVLAAAVAVPVVHASAEPGGRPFRPDESGCRDVTSASGTWTPGALDFTVSLAAAPCSDVTYTLFLRDADGSLVGAVERTGLTGSATSFRVQQPVAHAERCIGVEITTSSGPVEQGRVHDIALDPAERAVAGNYDDLCFGDSGGRTWY